MVPLVCARTTTRTTMQLSSLVRTGTTSKWFATNPRPDPSIEASAKDAPMSKRHKASFAIYLLLILGLYGFGLRYFFKSELTGYHALALGQSLSAMPPSFQITFLTSYRVDAAGILSMAVAMTFLLFGPFRRGEAWSRWAMTATGVCYGVLSLYANLAFTEATGIVAPWPVSVAILAMITLAHVLAMEKASRGVPGA